MSQTIVLKADNLHRHYPVSLGIGAVLGAITGTVAASVITMGMISLPIMLKYGYNPRLAPVVQWIELEFPKLSIQVRFLSGAPQNPCISWLI